MRRLVRESCDVLVRLPTRGQIHSLNAAVAGSVALYEVARQRWNAAGVERTKRDRVTYTDQIGHKPGTGYRPCWVRRAI